MRAVIVSSTQPRQPVGILPWVRASIGAVHHLAQEGNTLVTSIGTAPWDLVLCRAAIVGAPVHVIAPVGRSCPDDTEVDRITNDYGLQPGLVSWELLRSARSAGRRKDTWAQRDQAAFAAADKVFPVCIKPGGRIEALLREHPGKVDDRFRIPWQKPGLPSRGWNLTGPWIAPGEWPERALLHLTRSSDGPWPGETMHSYWAAITRSETRYPRDGFSTLCRILEERRIRASHFRIRAGASAVSLTALAPSETSSLFRWRSRYARYSFEPYALAIAREAVVRLGGRAVHYDDGASQGEADAFRQGRGAGARWENEQEWRVEGDVDLSSVGPAELGAVVATNEEALLLGERFPGLNVAAFAAAV